MDSTETASATNFGGVSDELDDEITSSMKSVLDSVQEIYNLASASLYRKEAVQRSMHAQKVPEQSDRRCIFCKEMFDACQETPLTTDEAAAALRLCPNHFGRQRTYHKEWQKPSLVCDSCTKHFRHEIKSCHYTKAKPSTFDRNYLNCSTSMTAAGRSFKLIFNENGGLRRYV